MQDFMAGKVSDKKLPKKIAKAVQRIWELKGEESDANTDILMSVAGAIPRIDQVRNELWKNESMLATFAGEAFKRGLKLNISDDDAYLVMAHLAATLDEEQRELFNAELAKGRRRSIDAAMAA